ncbi:MAG: hypothetical protein DMG08_19140 [Acidobacteria bacterium]|nr:MAG: hypothetical protein DMG08_19140 [Acidobacteriota bacterium]PYV04876.1 MAG: hypothetical protein DMG10_06700 [Acidobacteriota bacterium]PYV32011.1 MAG: hypothetical protein DMG09_24990 [Acidobacteriota bacterium]
MTLRTMHGSGLNYKNQEGKGAVGCLIFLLVLAICILAVVRLWPDYYAYKTLDTELRTEASRAGANFLEDEAIMANVLQLAKRSDVYITKKNVKIARIAGQIFITVHYSVPIDFIFYTWNMECDIKASSFVGRL